MNFGGNEQKAWHESGKRHTFDTCGYISMHVKIQKEIKKCVYIFSHTCIYTELYASIHIYIYINIIYMCINILLSILPTTPHRISCFNPLFDPNKHDIKSCRADRKVCKVQRGWYFSRTRSCSTCHSRIGGKWIGLAGVIFDLQAKCLETKRKIFGDTVDGRIPLPGEVVYHIYIYTYYVCIYTVYIYISHRGIAWTDHTNWRANWSKNINGISTCILNKVNGEWDMFPHMPKKYRYLGIIRTQPAKLRNKLRKGQHFCSKTHLLADCISFVPMAKPAKPGGRNKRLCFIATTL